MYQENIELILADVMVENEGDIQLFVISYSIVSPQNIMALQIVASINDILQGGRNKLKEAAGMR